jgi:hypothetical protein
MACAEYQEIQERLDNLFTKKNTVYRNGDETSVRFRCHLERR